MTIVFGGWAGANEHTSALDDAQKTYYEGSTKLNRRYGAWRPRGGVGAFDKPVIKNAADAAKWASQGVVVSTNLNPFLGTGFTRDPVLYQDVLDGRWDNPTSAGVTSTPGGISLREHGQQLLALQTAQPSVIITMELHSEIDIRQGTTGAQPTVADSPAKYGPWVRYIRNFWEQMGVNRVLYVTSASYHAYATTAEADSWFGGTGTANLITSGHIDLVGVDGYSRQNTTPKNCGLLFEDALAYARLRGSKVIIPECGCGPGTGDNVTAYGVTYNSKADWLRQFRNLMKANKADMFGFVYNHGNEGTIHYEPEHESTTSNSYTSPSWVAWEQMAADVDFALGTPSVVPGDGTPPPPPPPPPPTGKTFDEWETFFNRGFEVELYDGPTHTLALVNEFLATGSPEAGAITDIAPGTPYGTRHVTPLLDISMCTVDGTAYQAFNMSWQNIVLNASPKNATDPAGNTWGAWNETPEAYWRRFFTRVKNYDGPVWVTIHGRPELDLVANRNSAIAQGLTGATAVSAATYCAAFDRIVGWARAVIVPNLVGFNLELRQSTYAGTDPQSAFGDWSAMSPGNIDFLGCEVMNDYATTGQWRAFSTLFKPVHEKATALGKPLVLEIGSTPDLAVANRRSLWFDEARAILEADIRAYQVTQADPVNPLNPPVTSDVFVSNLDIEAMVVRTTGQFNPELKDPTDTTTVDTANVAMLNDVLNDPEFVPGGITTTARSFSRTDTARSAEPPVVLGKGVSSAVYDSGLYDSASLYDGVVTTGSNIFAIDSGLAAEVSMPPAGTSLFRTDAGGAAEQTVVARSGDLFLNRVDSARAIEEPSDIDIIGDLTLTRTDSAISFDFAAGRNITPDPVFVAPEYDTLFIADPADTNYPWRPSLVYVNLNELETNNQTSGWGYEAEIDLGRVENELVLLEQEGRPGGTVAVATPKVSTATIRLMGKWSTTPLMLTAYRKLAKAVRRGGILVWKPRGATTSIYIHFLPSDIPPLEEGQERAAHRLYGLKLALDFELVLNRQPMAYGAPVIGSPASLRMVPESRKLRVNNLGNAEGLLRVRVSPPATGKLIEWRCGIYSGDLTTYEGHYAKNIEDTTLENNTAITASPRGAGGSQAQTTVLTQAQGAMQRRWYSNIEPVAAGTYRLLVGMYVNTDCRVQMRYSLANSGPAETKRPIVRLTPSENYATNSEYAEIDMGIIRVPYDTDRIRIEGWAQLDNPDNPLPNANGTQIRWDQYVLMPIAQDFVTVGSPGYTEGERESDEFTVKGDDLGRDGPGGFTTVAAEDNEYRLNNQDEIAYVRPRTGILSPGGRHRVTFRGRLQDREDNSGPLWQPRELVRVEIWDLTTYPTMNLISPGFAQPIAQQLYRTRKNQEFTPFDITLEYDAVSGRKYAYVFRYNRPFNTGRSVYVRGVTDTYLRTTIFPEAMVLDGWDGTANIRTAADNRVWPLITDGYLKVPSGESTLVFSFGEMPQGEQGFRTLDARRPLPRVDTFKSYSVQLELVPAYMPG